MPITLVIDKDRKVGVRHFAIGKYYWQETKVPQGYTLDMTKYSFEIKKHGDDPALSIITENVETKEQVIRLVLTSSNFKILKSIKNVDF